MPPELAHIDTWLFDLDNTLYPASANLFALIDRRMTAFIADLLSLDLAEAHRVLRPGGRLHCATDWEDYAEQMWDVLDATEGLSNRAGPRGHVPRPEWRPQTHFETRGQKLGHGVWDLLYDRTP